MGRKPKRIMLRKQNRLGYGNQYLDVFENSMLIHLRGQPDLWLEPQIAKELAWKLTRAAQVQEQVAREKTIDKEAGQYDIKSDIDPREEFSSRALGLPTLADLKNQGN